MNSYTGSPVIREALAAIVATYLHGQKGWVDGVAAIREICQDYNYDGARELVEQLEDDGMLTLHADGQNLVVPTTYGIFQVLYH